MWRYKQSSKRRRIGLSGDNGANTMQNGRSSQQWNDNWSEPRRKASLDGLEADVDGSPLVSLHQPTCFGGARSEQTADTVNQDLKLAPGCRCHCVPCHYSYVSRRLPPLTTRPLSVHGTLVPLPKQPVSTSTDECNMLKAPNVRRWKWTIRGRVKRGNRLKVIGVVWCRVPPLKWHLQGSTRNTPNQTLLAKLSNDITNKFNSTQR